ncbi:preprotein translocase subunit SecY [Patescibacteria group bacterium]|nr:preprotein translocase subunit SecY [Patescibacteria group bacterium]MBU1016445.1 preprotein translocase subunit SecY [Patescibacteria group bacterium]MBU1684943.1 preprotein translocase subunit SecY [Patescibacteria group bacterium]MBU1939029.1 preprotein translocase subunit SecY [Patescibacteria group bacterium]
MFKYLHQIWQSRTLRKKILFTLFILIVFRLAAHITVPGVNFDALSNIFQQNDLLGVFSALTGGSMENFSIVLMGLSPYINASIIMQLMTVVIPKLEALSKEGMEGRRKINHYTRILTIPFALLQSYGMIILLNQSSQGSGAPLISSVTDPAIVIPIMIIVTAGTLFLMWLGELITESGIGNGISILIFASIISGMPTVVGRMLGIAQGGDTTKLSYFLVFMVLTILMLMFVVLITEGQRNIPITYATRATGGKSEKAGLPIRVNQAGMIPIIFAISMMTFPSVVAQFFQASTSPRLQGVADFILKYFNATNPTYFYMFVYFLLIIAFSYFYVSVTFNPEQVAENIQKRGGFIPGIRPGSQTADFLAKVSSHLNLFGGTFLAIVAVIPILFTKYTTLSSSDLIISGSGLIIVVGVVLEIIRQIDAQLVMHDYDKLY